LPLSKTVRHVFAVEKDRRLVELLQEKLERAGVENVTLLNGDILKVNLRKIQFDIPSEGRIQVMGNLPYNISSPVLEKLIDNRDRIGRAVLMFQQEVARRLTASPGGRVYGAITLWVRYHAHPTILFNVSREAFFPKPKVDSTVLELDFCRPFPQSHVPAAHFRKVLRGAFCHRRKTLLNSFMGFSEAWGREALVEAMKHCGIDPQRRAETLGMPEFLCLSAALLLTK
jgi:16S rRNA (adenine1518-N6/adenine1519-N6)-dimethyltransferase